MSDRPGDDGPDGPDDGVGGDGVDAEGAGDDGIDGARAGNDADAGDGDADGDSPLDDLPPGWTVWAGGADGRVVLAYRPDVFDAADFPAECLPTLYVTRGPKERRRPPTDTRGVDPDDWRVTLFLEPSVSAPERSFEGRRAALRGAVEFAREFAAGRVEYRSLYQVPRPAYCDRLDELTGRDDGGG